MATSRVGVRLTTKNVKKLGKKGKSKNWWRQCLVPSLPCRDKTLTLAGIKLDKSRYQTPLVPSDVT